MKSVVTLVAAVVLLCGHTSSAAKILLYPFGHCINSHLLNVEKLATVLLKDGHDISMLVPETYAGPYIEADFSSVEMITFPVLNDVSPICTFNTLQEFLETPFVKILQAFYKSTYGFCESLLKDRTVLDKIKRSNFDLAIYDTVDQCSKILADYIDIPFIALHTSGYESIFPRNPAYLPTLITTYTDDMNLGQRVVNTLGYCVQKLIVHYTYQYYQDLRTQYNMNSSMSVYQSLDRASLRFILGEHGMDYVGPMQPSWIMLGGFIHPPVTALEPALESFLDNGSEGVVVVSFGSIARNYGPEWRDIFAQAFKAVPYKVLWRYSEEPPKELGNNTMLIPWMPQSEVLSHPNVRVFVSHCGLNAAYEAAYNAVPVVAIPLFADQFFQAAKLTKHVKIGTQLNIKSLTSQKLADAIVDVGNDDNLRENANSIAQVMQKRPISQEEQIKTWVNYVLIHNGAPHLKSKEHDISWYQYYLLDVFCVIIGCFTILLVFTILLFKILLRFVRSKVVTIKDTWGKQFEEDKDTDKLLTKEIVKSELDCIDQGK